MRLRVRRDASSVPYMPAVGTRWIAALVFAAGLAAVPGCGGGSSAQPAASSPAPSSPSELPSRSGLVGAIDAARLQAFCGNVRLAETAIDGGFTAGARQAWSAALGVLADGTAPASARALAHGLRIEQRRHGLAAAVGKGRVSCP